MDDVTTVITIVTTVPELPEETLLEETSATTTIPFVDYTATLNSVNDNLSNIVIMNMLTIAVFGICVGILFVNLFKGR